MNTETETTEVAVTEAMTTEGVAITKLVVARERTFKADIAEGGWIQRLGKLMLELEELAKQADRKKVSSKMIKDAGLQKVTSAIRCEAKWLVQNVEVAQAFIKAGKFKGNNVSALKTAMAKAAKAEEKAKASTEGESESEASTEDAAKSAAEEKARVLEKLDVPTIAVAIHALAHRTGRDVADILDELVGIFAETDADSYFIEDRNAA